MKRSRNISSSARHCYLVFHKPLGFIAGGKRFCLSYKGEGARTIRMNTHLRILGTKIAYNRWEVWDSNQYNRY